jgi:hypothetical protein
MYLAQEKIVDKLNIPSLHMISFYFDIIVTFIFLYQFFDCRPSEGSNPDDWSSQTELDEYLKAEHTGRDEISPCTQAYPDCPYSLLSAFTKIMFT